MNIKIRKSVVLVAVISVGLIAGIVAWQQGEHRRVVALAREARVEYARDMTHSLGVVLQAQEAKSVIWQQKVKKGIHALTDSTPIESIALKNMHGDTIEWSGSEYARDLDDLPVGSVIWENDRVTVVEYIQLFDEEKGESNPLMAPNILSKMWAYTNWVESKKMREEEQKKKREEEQKRKKEAMLKQIKEAELARQKAKALETKKNGAKKKGSKKKRKNGSSKKGRKSQTESAQQSVSASVMDKGEKNTVQQTSAREGGQKTKAPVSAKVEALKSAALEWDPEELARAQKFRSLWRSQQNRSKNSLAQTVLPEDYKELYAYYGIHKFVVSVPLGSLDEDMAKDLKMRIVVIAALCVAILFMNFGMITMRGKQHLELRLVRAQEMNNHLREMNTMSAGLAHEIRNPLNIVRGVTQLMATDKEFGETTRTDLHMVSEEVDRVTCRLNELINYSKPVNPVICQVALKELVENILRTLETDREEKEITVEYCVEALLIQADEGLLRQVLFNMLLNAFQAVSTGGEVQINAGADSNGKLYLDVIDNGPGVPEESVNDIFTPYFSLSENGTGLGLAIVRQIVLAHKWRLDYIYSDSGAHFRIRDIVICK